MNIDANSIGLLMGILLMLTLIWDSVSGYESKGSDFLESMRQGSRTRDLEEKKKGFAKQFVVDFLDDEYLILKTETYDATGKYGRILGSIFRTTDYADKSVNEYLVEKGHAVPYFGEKVMRVNILGNGDNAGIFQRGTEGKLLVCNMPPFELTKKEVFATVMVDFKMMKALTEGKIKLDMYDWILGTRPRKWMELRGDFYLRYAPNVKAFYQHVPKYAAVDGNPAMAPLTLIVDIWQHTMRVPK